MKTKVFVLSIAISLISIFGSNLTYASTSKVSLKIEQVTYSQHDNVFYVYTEKDSEGGAWVIDVSTKNMTLKQAKKRYLNHIIDIYYEGNVQEDEEIEITKTKIN